MLLTPSTEDTQPVAYLPVSIISADVEPRADYPSGQLSIQSEDVGPICATPMLLTIAIAGSGSIADDPVVLDDSLKVFVPSGKDKRVNPPPKRPQKRLLASEGLLL
jgi:hypothetical protein